MKEEIKKEEIIEMLEVLLKSTYDDLDYNSFIMILNKLDEYKEKYNLK